MQNNLNFTTANTPDKLPTIIFKEIAAIFLETPSKIKFYPPPSDVSKIS